MKHTKALPYLFLLLISIAVSGCYTTSIEKTGTAEFSKLDSTSYRILYIHLKDGSLIDVINMDARFVEEFNSIKNVIVYHNGKGEYKYVKPDDIKKVVIEKTSFHAGQTIVAVIAILGAALAVLVFLLLSGFKNMH
jgi:hypothetical protein